MIKQANIAKISNQLSKNGGRRVQENVIERDYCLSWFLFGLAQSDLRNVLIFKGGTALRRCHFVEYRFSEDLDFSMKEAVDLEKIKIQLESVYSYVKTTVGIEFKFNRQEEPSLNTYTFYLGYKCFLDSREASAQRSTESSRKDKNESGRSREARRWMDLRPRIWQRIDHPTGSKPCTIWWFAGYGLRATLGSGLYRGLACAEVWFELHG